MTSRLPSRPFAPATTKSTAKATANPPNAIDNYDVDDDPFADSGDETVNKDGKANSQSKKRKETDGLGIDEAVSVAKKPREPQVKLDESRLLSENGIPRLRAKAQNLRFKGKGHEFSDTAKLLSFYQLWLDDLFPKAKFLDALSMVEKAGHKKTLSRKRIQWIEEGRPKPAGLEDDDDLFGETHEPEERDPALFPARVAPIFQNGLDKDARPPVDDDPFAEEDIYNASPKRPANATSAIASAGGTQANGEPDDDDLDALMAEAEAEAQQTTSTSIFGNGNGSQAQTRQTRRDLDDNDDLDAIMAEAEAESRTTRPPEPVNRRSVRKTVTDDDDDDDLDALMAEAEAADSAAKKSPAHDAAKNSAVDTHTVDEDEEAAMAEMEGLW